MKGFKCRETLPERRDRLRRCRDVPAHHAALAWLEGELAGVAGLAVEQRLAGALTVTAEKHGGSPASSDAFFAASVDSG